MIVGSNVLVAAASLPFVVRHVGSTPIRTLIY